MMHPAFRRLHQLFAWFFGYFWLPCPVCRTAFGGHEIADRDMSFVIKESKAFAVCPNPLCNEIAEAINRQYIDDHPECRGVFVMKNVFKAVQPSIMVMHDTEVVDGMKNAAMTRFTHVSPYSETIE